MTQLTAHFSLAELTRTEVRDADNTCPPALLPELLETAAMMERIRAALGADIGAVVRINVTSGYRSPIVNVRVGGSPNSDHLDALAVDFRAPDYGTPYQVAHFLARHADALQIGQVIHEFGRWVHVSRKRPAKEINRIITVSRAGTRSGILEVA
jgi:zinc D-Ala-D-Ala carboxypeptidase